MTIKDLTFELQVREAFVKESSLDLLQPRVQKRDRLRTLNIRELSGQYYGIKTMINITWIWSDRFYFKLFIFCFLCKYIYFNVTLNADCNLYRI